MVNRYSGSGDVIDHVIASTAGVAGDFRVSGVQVCCLLDSGAIGVTVPATVTGRHRVTTETGVAWVAGERVYLTAGSQVFTKTSGGNTFAGYAAIAKASAAAVGEVNLDSPGS